MPNESIRTKYEYNSKDRVSNYKAKHSELKRKLRFLVYENECFQETLRSVQRQLLKTNRDKRFLLDRILQYEKIIAIMSDNDDETDTSEDEVRTSDP